MNYLKVFLGIFVALAASRFIPHPPNFTSLIALSFYVPALLGRKFIPALVFGFIVTDLFIGFHQTIFFTWGSVILIGLISKYFTNTIYRRVAGALISALVFFLITNLGIWISGAYAYNFEGLALCYTMAIPFFAYSLISTFIFSAIIESIYKFKKSTILNKINSFKIL